jgi:cell division protein FtsN
VTEAAPQLVQRPSERLYLQVGAFENPNEADNLKARLALSGIQASAQRTQLPDGRVVHRVRVGPFSKPEDMNPMRSRLAEAGFSASVSRNP